MPSSTHRSSANIGRRSSGSSPAPRRVSFARFTDTAAANPGVDLDDATAYNTDLNRKNDECDHLRLQLERANKKLSDANRDMNDLKAQKSDLRASLEGEKESYRRMMQKHKVEKLALLQEIETLSKRAATWEDLCHELRSASRTNTTSMPHAPAAPAPATSTVLPDRTKSSRSRDKDKDKERGSRREREGKADKERLKGRFEEKRPASSLSGSASSRPRRQSFIEPWGAAGGPERPRTLMMPVAPHVSSHSHSRMAAVAPATSPALEVRYSPAYTTSLGYESGNYHPHPVG
ncbi:hypothetical protein AAL_06760 [Moelleriella libera RCEF 2490]|uniref:Uncharacterized protein n=1 Tax=Moelleriella libera RCEF 2490 TaxID=1081109 RepID=A0A167YMB2_9HYPO|nr:hypothetical protein AAL_06760 [Moelleriella libera RCEF 2490]